MRVTQGVMKWRCASSGIPDSAKSIFILIEFDFYLPVQSDVHRCSIDPELEVLIYVTVEKTQLAKF